MSPLRFDTNVEALRGNEGEMGAGNALAYEDDLALLRMADDGCPNHPLLLEERAPTPPGPVSRH